MESGIEPDYYSQDYYNYDQGYDLPRYGSRRQLIAPMYDEYGEMIGEEEYYASQPGKVQRVQLLVDRAYESSTGEDSTGESHRSLLTNSTAENHRNRLTNSTAENHRNRLTNCHSNINGNVYLAQNGTIIRTRRLGYPNNLKVGSPCRLGKQFKTLDKLGVTHEENVPLNSTGVTGNGTGMCISSGLNISLNSRPSSSSLGSSLTGLNVTGSKPNTAKALHERSSSGSCGPEEQESCVDTVGGPGTGEPHSEHTLSDEEELWMGPWNSLHIPMTKL